MKVEIVEKVGNGNFPLIGDSRGCDRSYLEYTPVTRRLKLDDEI